MDKIHCIRLLPQTLTEGIIDEQAHFSVLGLLGGVYGMHFAVISTSLMNVKLTERFFGCDINTLVANSFSWIPGLTIGLEICPSNGVYFQKNFNQ